MKTLTRNLLASALTFTTALSVAANVLPAPEDGSACSDGTTLSVGWEPVAGADRYSVEVFVEYDVDGDPETTEDVIVVGYDYSVVGGNSLVAEISDFEAFDHDSDELTDGLNGEILGVSVKALLKNKNGGAKNTLPLEIEACPPPSVE